MQSNNNSYHQDVKTASNMNQDHKMQEVICQHIYQIKYMILDQITLDEVVLL